MVVDGADDPAEALAPIGVVDDPDVCLGMQQSHGSVVVLFTESPLAVVHTPDCVSVLATQVGEHDPAQAASAGETGVKNNPSTRATRIGEIRFIRKGRFLFSNIA